MFIELMPLFERRTITEAALKQGRIRVNIVPTALAEDSKLNEKISYSSKEKIAQIPEEFAAQMAPKLLPNLPI